MKMNFLFLVIALFFSVNTFAYIPPFWMIASRVADNRADRYYKLEMDVVFNHDEETKVVRERWFIYDKNFMRLEVSSQKGFTQDFEATYVYRNGVRTHVDEKGRTKNNKKGASFVEPVFYAEKDSDLKNEWVRIGVIDRATLNSRPEKFNPKILKKKKDSEGHLEKKSYPKNPYVMLDRQDGKVSYKIKSQKGALWVEQDQFHMQKLLLPDSSFVIAKDYTRSRGLSFPSAREYHWKGQSAYVRLNQIRTLAKSAKNRQLVRISSLKGKNSELPKDKLIQSFYSKFR